MAPPVSTVPSPLARAIRPEIPPWAGSFAFEPIGTGAGIQWPMRSAADSREGVLHEEQEGTADAIRDNARQGAPMTVRGEIGHPGTHPRRF
jgi:hypothetical protein